MILNIYKDAFEYGGQDIKSILKLGLMSVFSFLIIPAFLVAGYEYRIIQMGIEGMIDGNDRLPEFNQWSSMFVDGIKFQIVQFLYVIIPVLIIHFSSNSIVGLMVGFILLLVALLFATLAIPNMIANNSMKEAFNFAKIIETIRNIGTFKYVCFYIGLLLIIAVLYLVVVGILLAILGLLGIATSVMFVSGLPMMELSAGTVVWIILSLIVAPYLIIFQNRSIGLIYAIGE